MERKEFVSRSWKAYTVIDYKDLGMKLPAECLLSSIDWDAEIMWLTPINEFYNRDEFPANIKYCSIPKRLKAAAVNGKKINDATENYIQGKKCP